MTRVESSGGGDEASTAAGLGSSERPDKAPAGRIAERFRLFAEKKPAGALLLLCSTAIALTWANAPWEGSYEALFEATRLNVGIAGVFELNKPLIVWINDGLMAIFFFSVGLEIKRELIGGELAAPRNAALPVASALGGMVVPALIYLAFAGRAAPHGWGVPMATDIAFALGILGLLGERVPIGLKVFLTALAIVDDIGAIIVIALFYTEELSLVSLGVASAAYAAAIGANLIGARNATVYFLIGTVVWLAFVESGVHATLAAVLIALAVPARTRIEGPRVLQRLETLLERCSREALSRGSRRLPSSSEQALYDEMAETLELAVSPLYELERALVPLVTFLVLPIFALANAGVRLEGVATVLGDPVAFGIGSGLLLGKPIGIVAFAWLAVRLGLADLPQRVDWAQLTGVSSLASIGFTMSLFIGSMAFSGQQLQTAKIAVLVSSTIAGVAGLLLTRWAVRPRPDPG